MISKIVSLAMAIASRGLNNKKIDLPTKQLRYASCYGTGIIPACSFLKKSKNSNYFHCTKCGCGDHPHTWLVKSPGEYSKLDYPVLDCPLKMPGFTNYDPNYFDKSDGNRKKTIENLNPETIQLIQITVNGNAEYEETFEKITKVIKNT